MPVFKGSLFHLRRVASLRRLYRSAVGLRGVMTGFLFWVGVTSGMLASLAMLATGACSRDRHRTHSGANENPVILSLGTEHFNWSDLERFLKLNINSLPDDVKHASDAEDWLARQVVEWLNHKLMLRAAEAEQIQVTDEMFRDFKTTLNVAWSQPEMELRLRAVGLTLLDWEAYERERLMTHEWVRRKWQLPPEFADAKARAFYEKNPKTFMRPEAVRLRHMVNPSREKMLDLRRRIVSGESFAKLAIEHSESPDRVNGGDMGFVVRGQLPKDLEEACFSMVIGTLSPVLQTEYGYHLFRVLDRESPGQLPFEEARPKLVRRIEGETIALYLKGWLQSVRTPYEQGLDWDLIEDHFDYFIKGRRHESHQ